GRWTQAAHPRREPAALTARRAHHAAPDRSCGRICTAETSLLRSLADGLSDCALLSTRGAQLLLRPPADLEHAFSWAADLRRRARAVRPSRRAPTRKHP